MKLPKIIQSEIASITIAIAVLSIVIGFRAIIEEDWSFLPMAVIFSFGIIMINILAKKIVAHALDADVEHKIWTFSRYGIKAQKKFKHEMPAGIILPLFFTFFFLGTIKFMSILSYETRALKIRAARRFGFYSFSEMTDFHHALIGGSGILAVLALSFISYFLPFQTAEILARMATYYALFNMIPISELDGTQIFFGSRVIYATLAILTAIFMFYSLFLV